jgi:hypothetical protein
MNVSGVNYIEKLEGPTNVLLVGDLHVDYRENACPMFSLKSKNLITDYLDNYLKQNSGEQFDLYLEQGRETNPRTDEIIFDFLNLKKKPEKALKHHNGYSVQQLSKGNYRYFSSIFSRLNSTRFSSLQLIRNFFTSKNCFTKDLDKCAYPNTRFHFIDIRQKFFGGCEIRKLHESFEKSTIDIMTAFTEKGGIAEEAYVYDVILALKEFEKCGISNTKVGKQISESNYGDAIMSMYGDKLKILEELVKDILEIWEEHQREIISKLTESSEYNLDTIDWISELYNEKDCHKRYADAFPEEELMRSESFDLYAEVLFAYTVTLMDIYSLGRMTKDYNNNVIVVAGMAHIRKYREFFLTNGWTSKWVGKNVNKKCITVPDLGVGKKREKLGKKRGNLGKTKTKLGKSKNKLGKSKNKLGKSKTKLSKQKKRVSKYMK